MPARRLVSTVAATLLVLVGALAAAAPAGAKGGEAGGSGNQFFLNDSWSAEANVVLSYGRADDKVYVGDWDGDRRDTLAVRRANLYYFRNTNSTGGADRAAAYGRPDDTVLVGDWDGDGVDTLAVRRGNLYHFKNDLTSGVADHVAAYGRPSDTVLVGDWDGDGVDTLAVRRANLYYVKNDLGSGVADRTVAYGRASDRVVVGDWDANRIDTLAVRRANIYYVKNSFTGGEADRVLAYGRASDTTLVGDWDGDGETTLGVRRVAAPPASFGPGTHRVGADIAAGTYRSTATGGTCYWERLAGFSGTVDDIIANDFGHPLSIVTIAPGDAGFSADGDCGSWVDAVATFPASPVSSFGDGTYVVGGHVAPGTYRAGSGEQCYWERVSGFSGTFDDIIANSFGELSVVTIEPGDAGFYTQGCGTWRR